ncbi:putative FAD-linked oxidoreductase [Pseudooceanicola marinus]|uniref:D-lactate dehydrogenase (cytochrome) n=1 Tax=Pseudooceanicola marinus TaxID=396013 RepID=A0A1X6Z939_9RHOB|nr:FAD-linked oxidase C-terminal domain-containing protein [Pseudooceanicola marinus]PJE28116.1 FAD-binding oxidoreductase [Pseudooceanicola marinus]SLN44481.1 putative FAD-linked oxidoreductase [Pseudooceanicola marinus]
MTQTVQPRETAIATVHATLAEAFGDRIQTGAAIRAQHANTATGRGTQAPDMVVWPESTEEVSLILRTCWAQGVPVIPFGAGSSLEGQLNAPQGGVSLDMSRMAAVLETHPEDLLAVVQPGITRKRLNEELRATGLTFPIDPGADASVGGMCATRASGTNAVRYGTMADNVLALEVVLADGTVIRTGSRAAKSSAGYDLTRLMIGSEGTLGVITEATLRLRGIPETVLGGIAAFPDLDSAVSAVILLVQMGLDIGRVELLDAMQIRACNAYSKLDLEETVTLFFECTGTEVVAQDTAETFAEIARDAGATHIDWSTDPDTRNKLWAARHDSYWAALALRPGCKGLVSDACVPISALAENISAAQADLEAKGLIGTILGHVGDGNFHVVLMTDPEDAEEAARVEDFLHAITLRAQAAGGTCTGEHGIGQGKMGALAEEVGPALVAMRAVKAALDPKGILNPGKIFAMTDGAA